jgi:hypothetical protein
MILMGFINFLRALFSKKTKKSFTEEETIYEIEEKTKEFEEIHSLWDYLSFIENTQAFHLKSVIGFNEWVSMDEIKRRIYEIFGVSYKNERSLYPYIKTMVDVGLLESINVGGKRKWRKKELIIKIKKKKKSQEKEVETLRIS